MRVISVNSVKVVCAVVLGLAGTSVQAFKPEYGTHGHTMITREILRDGYTFGERTDGSAYSTPTFTFVLSSEPGISRVASHTAAEGIIRGAQSRDQWTAVGRVLPTLNQSQTGCVRAISLFPVPVWETVPFFGEDTAWDINSRLKVPVENDAGEIDICTSIDLGAADAHFDSDNFSGSIDSIRKHLLLSLAFARRHVDAVDKSTYEANASRAASRVMLGKAIHTLQDFYAHSNWVERTVSDELFTPLTDSVLTGQALPASITGQLAKPIATKDRDASAGNPPGGGTVAAASCRSRIGGTTVAERSWFANDGNYALLDGAPLTSAAWWYDSALFDAGYAFTAAASDGAISRCDHGVTDGGTEFSAQAFAATAKFSGIAKDMPNWPLSRGPQGRVTGANEPKSEDYSWASDSNLYPSGFSAKDRAAMDSTLLFRRASYLAALHTKELLNRFVDLVKQEVTAPSRQDDYLVAVFGGPAPANGLGWVVDRSGTMADIFPAIKTTIFDAIAKDEFENIARRYVLVDFANTPDATDATRLVVTSGDAAQIRARLAAISPRGGDGCATPMWTAVEAATKASFKNSTLVAYTDASSSDAASKQAAATALMQQRHIAFKAVVSGSCSPIDASYANTASATNGAMVLVEHDEEGIAASRAANLIESVRLKTIHSEGGALPTASRAINFPVESAVKLLVLTVTGPSVSIVVTQPSGAALVASADVTFSRTLNGGAFVVRNPQQGAWQISLSGMGGYTANIAADATIDFATVDMKSVLKTGRPGHEYRPQLSSTGQSGRLWFSAHVIGARAPVALDLLGLDGTVVNSFPIYEMTPNYFEGEVTLPTEAHRLRVRGLDVSGIAFARILGQGNVAPQVAPSGRITAGVGATGTWRAGTVNAFAMNLKNLGGSDTVSLTAGTLPTGATMTCNPGSITLPGSEQVNVLCSLNLPEVVDRTDFTVNVSSATSAQAVSVPLTPLKLPLSCALDVDGDNRVDPAVDGLLLTRYLLGFRGAALTQGLTIAGPRKTSALVEAFFGNAAQFDVIGRAAPAPSATVDGLIMTRLMLGVDDAGLLSGINLPAGALFASAAAIRANVIAKCAGGF